MTSFCRVCAIVVVLSAAFAVQPLYGGDGSADSAQEFERIQREMLEKKKEIKRANRKERSVIADLDKFDRDIQEGLSELANQQRRLRDAEVSLLEIEKSGFELRQHLAELQQLYRQRLRALYKMRRENATILLLDSPHDIAKQIKYLSCITQRNRNIMDEYGSALTKLSAEQTQIAGKKTEILERRRIIETKRAELEVQRRRKSIMLASVRQEKGLHMQALHELEEASSDLWAMIQRDEQERRTAKERPISEKGQGAATEGKLPWPVDGPVLTRFGMQRHPQFGDMVFRRGIEIAAHEGQAVHAVDDGQVAYADWYKGYGKLIIIDHGNGFYSLYGNLSKLDLVKGDHAAKGAIIGLAGDTGSMKGSKLYFEIRRNGEAQDPMLWLAKR